ncbi:hypothetical protein Tco_1190793 [Tanacetum coccineum]
MDPEYASSEVVHALSPIVVDSNHIVHKSSSEGLVTNQTQIKFTSSNSIIRRQVEEPVVEVDMSSTLLGRVLNMEQIGKVIGFVVVVVTQMSGSSKNLKNHSLCLLGAILVVYAMKLWVMPACKVKWKVMMFEIASMSADKCSHELKTKFTWFYEKSVLVISYVIDKVLNSKCKDQVSLALAPPCASV